MPITKKLNLVPDLSKPQTQIRLAYPLFDRTKPPFWIPILFKVAELGLMHSLVWQHMASLLFSTTDP